MKTEQEQIEKKTKKKINVEYKNAICCRQSYGSIYDYMRIIGLKKKQQKGVTKYISKLREVQRQNND